MINLPRIDIDFIKRCEEYANENFPGWDEEEDD